MSGAIFGSVEAGIIYAIMALGVYLSFRILDFPDLTVDGSFVTGAATAAMLITAGYSPIIATLAAVVAGFLAGMCTGLLHTKGNINPLLAGILMMIALYSINLRIMGKPNIALLFEETVITKIKESAAGGWMDSLAASILGATGLEGTIPASWSVLIVMAILLFAIKFLLSVIAVSHGISFRYSMTPKRVPTSIFLPIR